MKCYDVAVLGATGAVGRQMMQVLQQRDFPVGRLLPLASARSAGQTVWFRGEAIPVREANDDAFRGMDFVFGAASADVARRFAPAIARAGAIFVDNSSAFRLDGDVPLVVPEVNPEDVRRHRGIISNPNCSTIITLVALSGIRKLSPIETIVACTYQAVSGAGIGGMRELEAQIAGHVRGENVGANVFPCRILSNVIPQIGSELDNGYTTEEMKMQNEGRKIMHLPNLRACCTCVRVPVLRAHSIAVQFVTERPLSLDAVRAAVSGAEGCVLVSDLDGRDYPTPLDAADQDRVYVGRVRRDLIDDRRGFALWCCGDQLRKGAATNCVQIAELLI